MPWMAIVVAVVAAVAAAAQAYMQSQALKKQATAAESNAENAAMEARNAVLRAQQDTLEISRKQRQVIGRQAALFGYAGVEMTGSPLEVMADTAANAERDIMYRGYAGDMQMRSKMYESQLYEWQAQNLKDEAKSTLMWGLLVKAPLAGASAYMGAGGGGGLGGMFPGMSSPSAANVQIPQADAGASSAQWMQSMGNNWMQTGQVGNEIDKWRMNSLWGTASPHEGNTMPENPLWHGEKRSEEHTS